jgi:hypothetical protein
MWRLMLGLFLVAHGLVHLAVWALPTGGTDQPFDPHRSWLLGGLGKGPDHWISTALAITAAAFFIAAGYGLVGQHQVWRLLAVVAAMVSLVLIATFFNPWLVVGLGLEVAILTALLWADWPGEDLVGA